MHLKKIFQNINLIQKKDRGSIIELLKNPYKKILKPNIYETYDLC